MADELYRKKAELLLGGDLRLPEGYDDPLFEHRDGAPYAAVLVFGDCRAKKKFSENGEFFLKPMDGYYQVLRDGELFLDEVEIKQLFNHSPDIAVINLSKDGVLLSAKDALALVENYSELMNLEGITLHSGDLCSKEHYLSVVGGLHWWNPDLPIGISSYGLTLEEMKAFREAGAVNFKIAVQSPVKRVQEVLESEIPLDDVYAYLADLVSVFGRNHVVCTTYIGVGETEEEFLQGIEKICSIGIMPDIKVKKLRGNTLEKVKEKIGEVNTISPEQWCRIVSASKDMMERNDLDARYCSTGCYGCRLCTIVPFKEF